MAAASRMHAVEQGVDLRGVTADRVRRRRPGPRLRRRRAARVAARRVPGNASVLSAFGTLVTPVRIDLARSSVRPLGTVVDPAERDALLDELRAEGRRVLAAAGVRPRAIRVPLRRSTPATSARATRSRSGSARATRGRPTTPSRVERFDARVPPASTA